LADRVELTRHFADHATLIARLTAGPK
jgi:hypothetical protein